MGGSQWFWEKNGEDTKTLDQWKDILDEYMAALQKHEMEEKANDDPLTQQASVSSRGASRPYRIRRPRRSKTGKIITKKKKDFRRLVENLIQTEAELSSPDP